MKERVLKFVRSHKKVLLVSLASFLILGTSGAGYYLNIRKNPLGADTNKKAEENYLPQVNDAAKEQAESKSGAAKKAVKQNPPKVGGGGLSSSTRTNSDGSTTTGVSIGGTGDTSPSPQCGLGAGSPSGICYVDEVGSYGSLGDVLKDYLATLRWSNEIGSLYEISVVDAGASGWGGMYSAYYNMSGGDITSAYGWITLNVYYYKDSPYFVDYMKLVLSHEYGHHYTLWHKWVDMNLPIGVRLPDEYYNIRPLSKANTATDYSLGWSNCELEIIAEDYSYFYSGYGLHAMKDTRGYPSGATRTWLNNMASFVDNAPTVSITTPTNGATISATITFSATANDDLSVSKVSFYINDALLADDTSSPYETSLNTASYPNGSYILKAIAYDAIHNTPATITVNISN